MGRSILSKVLTDKNIKQMEIDLVDMRYLGIENYKDVTVVEVAETGAIRIFSSSMMAAEIERLEQLKGGE